MELIDKEILTIVKNSINNIAKIIKENNIESYNILIDNRNTIERLLTHIDDNYYYTFPMPKDFFIRNFELNDGTVRAKLRQFTKEGLLSKGKDKDYFIDPPMGPTAITYFNEKGAKKLLEKMQSIEGAKYLFRKYNFNIYLKKCFLYINMIKYAVMGIDDPKKEYTISNPTYRIDLYLKKSRLAIECDELDHEQESYTKRYNREEVIKNKLGCKILRFNPHDEGFNIGKFITLVLRYILLGSKPDPELGLDIEDLL